MKVENSYFTFTVVALLNGLLYWGGFYNKQKRQNGNIYNEFIN